MDKIGVLLKTILSQPTDAEINAFVKKVQTQLGKVPLGSNGGFLPKQEEIDIYIKKLQNSLQRMQFKTPKVFDNEGVKKEIEILNKEFEKLRNNATSIKQVGLQFDNLKTKVSEVSSHLKNTTKDGYNFAQMLELAGKKIAIWGISTQMVYGTWRQIKEGIQYITDLDNALNEIRIVTNKNQEEVNKLALAYNNLSKIMKVSTKDVTSEAANLFRQGLNESQVEERMKAIIKYAKISSISLADSDKIITATANATGESVQKIIDIFALLGDTTASGADEIGESLQRVASAAENSGLSLEKSASWLATISSITRESSSTIGRSLNSLISRYEQIKSTGFNSEDATKLNDVVQALSKIGITATDTAGQLMPIADVVDTLGAKWDTLTKNEKSYIATTLGGTYQRNRLITLLDNYSTSITNYETALNSAGVADQKFAIYQDSVAAKLDAVKASWEGFWQSSLNSNLIKATLDSLSGLINTFGNLETVVTSLITVFALWKGTAVTKWIGGLKLGLQDLRVTIIANRGAVIGMTEAEIAAATATKGLTLSWNALKIAFLSNPIGMITTVILTAVTAIDIFNAKQEEIKQRAAETASKLEQEVSSLQNLKTQYVDIIKSGDLTTESKNKLKSIQDQLVKTYGLEADAIDLVNGKYKDQIDVINEVIAKKAKDYLTSQQSVYQEAVKEMNQSSKYNFGVGSTFMSIGRMTDRSTINDAVKDAIGKSYSSAINSESLTLEQYKNVLQKVIDKQREYYETKKKGYIGDSLLAELTDEFNRVDGLIKENQSIIDKYLEQKNIEDFYNTFKANISKVNDLMSQSAKNPNNTGLTKQVEDLYNSMMQLANSKGRLADFEPFINDLFNKTSDSLEDTSQQTEDLAASLEKLNSTISDQTKELSTLSSAYSTLHEGESLSADDMLSLITNYKDIATYIANTSDLTLKNGDIVKQVFEVKKQAIVDELALEKEKYLTLTKLQQEFYGSKTNGLTDQWLQKAGLDSNAIISELDAKIAAIKKVTIETFSGSKKGSTKEPQLSDILKEEQKYLNNITEQETKQKSIQEDQYQLQLKNLDAQEKEQHNLLAYYESNRKLAKSKGLENELNEKILKTQSDIVDLESQRKKIASEMVKQIQEMYDTIAEARVSLEDDVQQALKDKYDQQIDDYKEMVEEEKKLIEDRYQTEIDSKKRLKELNQRNFDESKFIDDQKARYEELAKLQQRYNKVSLDTSKEGQKEKFELDREIADLTKEIHDKDLERNLEIQSDNYDDQITLLEQKKEEETDALEKSLDKQNAVWIAKQNELLKLSYQKYWEAKQGLLNISQEVTDIMRGSQDSIISFLMNNSIKFKEAAYAQGQAMVNGWKEKLALLESEQHVEQNLLINYLTVLKDKYAEMGNKQGVAFVDSLISQIRSGKVQINNELVDLVSNLDKMMRVIDLKMKWAVAKTQTEKDALAQQANIIRSSLPPNLAALVSGDIDLSQALANIQNSIANGLTSGFTNTPPNNQQQSGTNTNTNTNNNSSSSSQPSTPTVTRASLQAQIDSLESQKASLLASLYDSSGRLKSDAENASVLSQIGPVSRQIEALRSQLNSTPYATGGINDFTGTAFLHGKPSAVETIFNAEQGKKLYDFVRNLPNSAMNLMNNIRPIIPNYSIAGASSGTSQEFKINVNLNGFSIANDMDITKVTQRVGTEIKKEMQIIGRGNVIVPKR